ncbi:MAG: flippase-like domain-containing protein [Melioribacteraceae bacterium]|nr:flippase-like domain-containing protein [Melioribacteraceae bacterium]
MKKFKKHLVTGIIISVIIYLGFSVYTDFNSVVSSFVLFNWILFPVILLTSLLNYLFRFIKWHYYLKILKINVPLVKSFLIFLSGLAMSVTPGKMGELLKSYFLKEMYNESFSKSSSIIITERITDFISLVMLAMVGVYFFDYGKVIVYVTGLFFLRTVLIISNRKLSIYFIELLEKINLVKKFIPRLKSFYEASYNLLKLKPLFNATVISLAAWFFECFGFYLVLTNFDNSITLLWALFVYTFSTIAGAITMLPAGIGVTEGSLSFLLIENGLSESYAVASTILIRIATLWFAVFIGLLGLLKLKKFLSNKEIDVTDLRNF